MTNPFPVAIGVCLDAEAIWLNKFPKGEHRPILLSHGTYAIHEGLEPLLEVFARHGVEATFYVPGVTADRWPDAAKRCRDAGHEIASHTYGHQTAVGMSREEERDDMLRGIDAVERAVGARPKAWRSASWEFSENTIDLMLEAGVEISANYQDRSRPYRLERDGETLPIVELPVHWHLADAPYFLYGGLPGRAPRTAAEAEAVWREEFDALYRDRPGSFFHLTLHVQLIGHPGRLAMLNHFLGHIRGHSRSRFMTASDIAATVA